MDRDIVDAERGTVGQRVAWARSVAGLRAVELDRLAGLCVGHVSVLEWRGGTVTPRTAERLASALGVRIEWLLYGREPAPREQTIRRAVAAQRRAAG